MEIKWLVILLSFLYLGLLFGIAYWAERNSESRWVNNPYIYALSMAVYCTAWTYYGSVGRAANQGLDFLTTYIGPLLMAPLMWIVIRKIIRICKVQRITTIADFVSSRYGKNIFIGGLVAFVCAVGVLPYISIQIKAISNSFLILTGDSPGYTSASVAFFNDTAFYITILLAIFTILFGANRVDSNLKNNGLIAAIAFESIFKLAAFIFIGLYVTFGLFNGFGDIFQQSSVLPDIEKLLTIPSDSGYSNWMWLNILSMLAIVLLPRQFHVTVKENRNENHLKKAMWLFPLYLLLINIFVIPIALGGKLIFQNNPVDADTYMLAIPLQMSNTPLALLTYLGGLSAATSMIIVSTTALGVMLSNSILTPLIVKNTELSAPENNNLSQVLLRGRQILIAAILLLAYIYFKYVSDRFSIVSIGLISFVAVAQFAPAVLLGMYWKNGTRSGAIAGILSGFAIWFYTLVLPTIVSTGLLPEQFIIDGPFGVGYLSPNNFLGVDNLSPITNGFFWSIFINLLTYVVVSLLSKQSSKEINQAEVFVDIFQYSTVYESSIVWKGTAYVQDIKSLLNKFIGEERTNRAFRNFMINNKINSESLRADFRLVNYAEKLLAGVVGSASSRVLISNVVKEDNISMNEVFDILQESRRFISDNKALKEKSDELEIATQQLQIANEELKKLDQLKDEFISTVTHEMRTPLTSIRAMSEIIHDNPDLEDEERSKFLDTVISETKRMDRLISQVLDLEKMESGKLNLELSDIQFEDIISDSLDRLRQVIKEKNIDLDVHIQEPLPMIKGNKDRLMQVVINLISNATKHCPEINGKIIINAQNGDGNLSFIVEDNGPGVSPESRELIFEAFYQAKNQTLKKPEGSGLGLTISKKIIELHRGKIWVENSVTGGARFQCLIPLN
ncbi:MAG: ATP-binding protein [Fulvivirga sp.]|uniref:ATP-binding protein n=1 Tax=Fulvivirga sp. TaxID=1931237 RepID=UPI0032EC770D